jgi:hypothetical protein
MENKDIKDLSKCFSILEKEEIKKFSEKINGEIRELKTGVIDIPECLFILVDGREILKMWVQSYDDEYRKLRIELFRPHFREHHTIDKINELTKFLEYVKRVLNEKECRKAKN